jgi:hypothetical protein
LNTTAASIASRGDELFFPIAMNEQRTLAVGRRRPEENRRGGCAIDTDRAIVYLFDPGQPVVQALVKPRREHFEGCNDVNPSDRRSSRQQVEVGVIEAAGFGDPVGDGHDQPEPRVGGCP